ncbi:MAG: serine/threonine protein kinase [Myxococcales bacterium]|nr:serine/threonine protein kinase [Myxococcales bacterium]
MIRHLASGGMAEIYLARDGADTVVVKVISRDRGHDKKFIQMFLDEARVAATLHHPNIAGMLEVGRQDDTYFLAMEFVDGDTARALLERAVAARFRIPLPVCLHIVTAVAAGLHHAHERKTATGDALQIVHRDVTPSNIMVAWNGEVKLLDFGIAQANNRAAETQSGTIKGKFAYMSPEQCRGKGIDRRTDVFALGIVLYELTTQRRAFRTDSDFATMDRIVNGRIDRPTSFDPTYPRELEDILMTALATEIADRYPTAEALRAALVAYAQRTGAVATLAEVAACMAQVFHGAASPPHEVESTASDIDVEIRVGGAGADDRDLDATDHDDAASTLPRLTAAELAASASSAQLAPSMTGPMPVMPPVRPSGSVDVPALDPILSTGSTPRPAPVHATGPQPQVARAHVTGPTPRIPVDEWNAPMKTILGTGPTSVNRSAAQPALTDSGRRPRPVLPEPVALPLETITPPAEPTHIRRRQRRGLTLALIAVVVVAAVATAVVLLGAGRTATSVAPAAAPTAPR